jgi:hypothetical protein
MKKIVVFLFSLLMVLIIPATHPVSAHLAAGEDKTVGDYISDFGYEPKIIHEKEKAVLAFNLVDKTTNDKVNIKSVWVRISSKKEVVFSGTFLAENNNVTISYMFPSSGKYDVDTQFNLEDGTNIKTDNAVNVEKMPVQKTSTIEASVTPKEPTKNDIFIIISLGLGALAALLLRFYIKKNIRPGE